MTRRFECHLAEFNANYLPSCSLMAHPMNAFRHLRERLWFPSQSHQQQHPSSDAVLFQGKAAVDFSSPLWGSYLAQSTLWSNPPSRIANLVQVVDTILHLKLGGLSLAKGDTLSHAGPSFILMPGILSKTLNLYSDELMCLGVETLLTVPPTLHLDICVLAQEYLCIDEQAP